ncbi:hypothetical protein shim_13370 [Shimia sp. SK013]|uniref:hypothetical protein n=1 Tax=Shimia sp. SK013 TaxID=1389006 RepID=UPI0006B4CAEC|nr:hypothetical protein [Shimia sp. SK013]KPA23044.1 hypothetical protein shim_13370 [Shimia sp. SK013]
MQGLASYLSFAALVLFFASVFVLARANGWSVKKAAILVVAICIAPLATAWIYLQPAFVGNSEVLSSALFVVVMLVLFALTKSVSKKVASHD